MITLMFDAVRLCDAITNLLNINRNLPAGSKGEALRLPADVREALEDWRGHVEECWLEPAIEAAKKGE